MTLSFYYWLSSDPPVLRHSMHHGHDIGEVLPHHRIYRFLFYCWHQTVDDIERVHHRAMASRPKHVLHHLVDEHDLCVKLNARGIAASFVSHNAMLDERIFVIHPQAEKRYDAVYNARMAPFKRHHLARDIKRLLIIGGIAGEEDTQAYFEEIRRVLSQADFTHAADNAWLPPQHLAPALNGARVGLCLSAVEGAMYAAVEYLLCGLPVVSTASRGGRAEWFDPEFTRIVRDNPAAVADAVNELADLNVPPQHIRQQTLRRLWSHRRRFAARVQDIYDSEQVGRDFSREWYSRFFHKMGHWRDPRQVMDFLAKDCC